MEKDIFENMIYMKMEYLRIWDSASINLHIFVNYFRDEISITETIGSTGICVDKVSDERDTAN
ncbi:hypothetical protein APT_01547 [Acetobacter pasteurianus NBRC 101655]|nr:hypothetical protein APT_01547 [Acetobacter pasteurianus NBRC 101655]